MEPCADGPDPVVEFRRQQFSSSGTPPSRQTVPSQVRQVPAAMGRFLLLLAVRTAEAIMHFSLDS